MKTGRPAKLDAETVRIVRRWHQAWIRIPKPSQVAKALGMSKGALDQMARGQTYKWVRP